MTRVIEKMTREKNKNPFSSSIYLVYMISTKKTEKKGFFENCFNFIH